MTGLRQWFVAPCSICRRRKLALFRSVVPRKNAALIFMKIDEAGVSMAAVSPKKKAPAEAGAKFREETPKKCVCAMNRAVAAIHDALHNMRNREFVSRPTMVSALLLMAYGQDWKLIGSRRWPHVAVRCGVPIVKAVQDVSAKIGFVQFVLQVAALWRRHAKWHGTFVQDACPGGL
jgi:hypothetical protein